jgi:hypothetical protein
LVHELKEKKKMVVPKLSYEESRRKRLEENKKRMEALNLPLLAQALKTSSSPKPSPVTSTLTQSLFFFILICYFYLFLSILISLCGAHVHIDEAGETSCGTETSGNAQEVRSRCQQARTFLQRSE